MAKPRTLAWIICAGVLFAPTPAFAWLGDGWLEKLSGPGPFHGLVADVRFVCLATEAATKAAAKRNSDPARQSLGWKASKSIGSHGRVSTFGCNFYERNQSRLEVGLQYGHMKAAPEDNNLSYAQRPDVRLEQKEVGLHNLMATADVRLNSAIDVGAGIGRASFRSKAFGVLHKAVVQPVRVTLRPLSPLTEGNNYKGSWLDAFSVRVECVWFSGGLRDVDFGADPGTFRAGELAWSWSALVDLSPLFWH